MFNLTLETINPDVVVEILSSFGNFKDLHRLLLSSPVCYRTFNCSTTVILTRVAKNFIGVDAWQEVATVLTYQRHSVAGTIFYPGIEKDLKMDFMLKKIDIPNLVANQQFFKRCSEGYKSFTLMANFRYPPDRPTHQCRIPRNLGTIREPLRGKTFYQSWQLGLQYGHESIRDFACHKSLDFLRAVDIHVLSRVMIMDRSFNKLIYPPRWGTKVFNWGNPFWCDMFKVFGNGHYQVSLKGAVAKNIVTTDPNYNHLLYMKAVSHLAASTSKSYPGCEKGEFCQLVNEFQIDYAKMDLEALTRKYGLDFCSWE